MSDDRLSHEQFLEELAAFDKVLRAPAAPARPPMPPPDLGLDEPLNLVPPSRETDALRAVEASPSALTRPSRISGPWVGALSVGLLAGGLLGWWLASNPIVNHLVNSSVRAPLTESAARAPSTTGRAATAAIASQSSRPATLPPAAPLAAAPREIARTIEAARESAATTSIERRIIPPPRSPPSAPSVPSVPSVRSVTAGGAGIPSGSIVSPPSIAAPLPAVPLAVRPSMPPVAPPARAAAGTLVTAALATAVAADEAAIETALRQYEDAYERLDAKAAVAVWPTVDQRALSRAFAGLASQDLVFRGCEVVVGAGASTATASCRGTAEYVQKVGNARPHVEPREWLFTLNKTHGEWRIETVDGRR
jgi:hypothetical protein